MSNSLEERLQEHSNAFDGLLSLIPAKYYYDEGTSNQWQQKRKSKEEHQVNKRQKLDPENNKNLTAKDVLKETEKVAKPVVLPGEKFKQRQLEMKEMIENSNSDEEIEENNSDEDSEENNGEEKSEFSQKKKNNDDFLIQENVTIIFDDNGEEVSRDEYKKAEIKKKQENKGKKQLSKEEQEERERKHKELKAKLQAKIQTMREKRKAPGTKIPGAATSRQQILEERRRKAELKKEQKKKEIEADEESSDDDENDDEDNEATAGANNVDANVMFGNIEFLDGERVSSDLSSTRKVGKKKGPANKDIKGHLKKLEREKQKAAELDQDARKKLEDKNKWQKALASVQGVKVKDDEKLLKKALRRKESIKRKSEREWKDRIQTLADEKKMKTDRREENLRIRKENRGRTRKDQIKQLPSYKRSRAHKKLAGGAKRAGFEGGIRSHKKKK
jgi:hypothetical protein